MMGKRQSLTLAAFAAICVALLIGVTPVVAQESTSHEGDTPAANESSTHRAYEATKTVLSDTAVTAKVKTAIADDKVIHHDDIHVKTESGVVTLSGSVPTIEMSKRATELTRGTTGVKDVVNNLKVVQTSGM